MSKAERELYSEFSDRVETKICYEQPSKDNPYIAESRHLYGYPLKELAAKKSYSENLFLMITGNLPDTQRHELFEKLMSLLMAPGNRHVAIRAATLAGAGRTQIHDIIPIGAAAATGANSGTQVVAGAFMFFSKSIKKAPSELVSEVQDHTDAFPGFGKVYDGVDLCARDIAETLLALNAKTLNLEWGDDLARLIEPYGCGWTIPGVAAAAFRDLGFRRNQAACAYQLALLPAVMAHGLEASSKSPLEYPFLGDDKYEYRPR
jgi:citrate synthase